jgi:NNP family nitrate/nitrite transporter-like MFS transporter
VDRIRGDVFEHRADAGLGGLSHPASACPPSPEAFLPVNPTRIDTSCHVRPPKRRGRWIERWDPEDEAFWETTGRRIARRNLAFSIFAEHIGFSIWVLWTIVVINLGNIGIALSVPELFLLTAVPNLVGAFLRIPYTFAVPRFGGQLWTTISASLLLIPTLLLAIVVPSGWLAAQSHDTQLWVLIACAATANV